MGIQRARRAYQGFRDSGLGFRFMLLAAGFGVWALKY